MTDEEIKEILKGQFTIEIPNFNKWNKDLKNEKGKRAWSALAVDWFHDPKLMRLSLSEQATWLRLGSHFASNQNHFRTTSTATLALSVLIKRQRFSKTLAKLLKLQLVVFGNCFLQDKTDKTDKTREDVGVSKSHKVMDELQGIDDVFFSGVSNGVQKSWLTEFGKDLLKAELPTFLATWEQSQPKDQSGRVRPKMLWIANCLKNARKNKGSDWAGENSEQWKTRMKGVLSDA